MVHFFPSMPEDMQAFIHKQPVFFVASAPLNGKHVNVSPKGHPSRTFAILSPNRVAYLDFSGSSSETISHIYENGRVTVLFNSFLTSAMIVRLYCTGSVIERDDPRFRSMIEEMHEAGMERHEPHEKIRDAIQAELDRRARETAEKEANGDVEPEKKAEDGKKADEDPNKKKRKFQPEDADMRPSDGAGIIGARAIIVLDVWKCMRSCGFGVPLMMMSEDGKLREGVTREGASSPSSKGAQILENGASAEESAPVIDSSNKNAKPPSPPATPTRVDRMMLQPRSHDPYDVTGIKFDEDWDDRNRMGNWASKMVVTGQIWAYRRKYNHLSLDGLPGIRMTCFDWQERLSIQIDAWVNHVLLAQWRTLLLGMLLALLGRRIVVHYFEISSAW